MKFILFDYRSFARIISRAANAIAAIELAQILIICCYPYVLHIIVFPPSLFTKLRVCTV